MKTLVVERSENKKLGSIATTYRTQESCPTTCVLFENGCYARGRIFGLARKFGTDDNNQRVRDLVKEVPPNGSIRFNVSGDFLSEDGTLDADYVDACNYVADTRPDIKIIAYTHAWRQIDRSVFHFSVNASCESLADLVEALDLGWQAVLADTGEMLGDVVEGRRVIQCPAQTRDVTCRDCNACAADTRTRPIIAFVVHGNGAKKATAAIEKKRG